MKNTLSDGEKLQDNNAVRERNWKSVEMSTSQHDYGYEKRPVSF